MIVERMQRWPTHTYTRPFFLLSLSPCLSLAFLEMAKVLLAQLHLLLLVVCEFGWKED